MVLLNGMITNDKFCMIRQGQVKLRWSRRPYRFRPRKSDYAPHDTRHEERSHEMPLADTAAIPANSRRGTTVGSVPTIPHALDRALRTARRFSPPPCTDHRRRTCRSTAIYARVSTERQTLAQTIEQQVERLTAHVRAQGETLRPEDIFRADGDRGATLNRPGVDRLRELVKEATLDRIVCASPDRLARDYVYQMVLLEEFEHAGCRVEFFSSLWGRTHKTISWCKSGEPWLNTNVLCLRTVCDEDAS